jgi:outer membrane autotransporter barrel domain protein
MASGRSICSTPIPVAACGLRLAADGNGGELSADVTGSGNIVYAGGNIRVSGSNANDYTGSTYVENGASVTLDKNDAFGKTDYLEIAAGGSVSLADGLSQVVGELAGSGSLSLGSGSSFTINNSQRQDGEDDPAAKDEIVIETAITAASGSTFVINGSGAETADHRASVSFAQDASLSGANFSLENAQLTFDLSDSGNYSYVSVNDTSKFTLGSNSALLIDARNGSASQNYQLNNTLTLSGGLISFDDVLFTTGSQGTTAILNVGTLDVTDVGYIGVSAAIDDNFNILDADTSHFTQALIHYENETEGSREKLEAATSDQMDDSAISNTLGDTVAYVEWSGGFVDESPSTKNTIVMSYQVAKLKLAQGGDAAGLVLDATGHDSELSVLITDDEQAGSSGGNITFAGGDIRITNSNEYTGVTTLTTGSATLGADNGFGNTRLLDVVSGYVNFGGFSQTLGSIDVNSADGIRGSGSVTLGSDAYQGLHSLIRGEQSAFTGNVTLTNGHTLELSDTLGIGSSGTVVLKNGTRLVINDQSADNRFSKVVNGEEGATVELSGSGFNIYADNTNYFGDWSLTSGTTASVSGSGSVGVDSILGQGGTVALGTNATLALSQDSGSIVVDNVFAGAGNLVVSGTSDQEFGFSTNWTDAETSGFTGTLSLEDGIKMTVGGGSGSGFYNAANLANADFNLGSASTLTVALQDSIVDTFDVVNVSGGTISFAGEFGLGTTTEELGHLKVGSLSGSGNIALTIPDANGTVDQTIGQNDLLTIDDVSHFQALITAETGTVSESGWTLNDSTTTSGSGLRQAVRNAGDTDTVAHAIYDYALATGKVNSANDSLGIEYTLKTVDIVDAKTLELSNSGSLSAVITDSSGAGTLLITGQIKLTGENEYDSVTWVSGANASLTVGSSGLGATSSLDLSGGATFVNAAGATNSAERMRSSGSNIVLNEGSELKLTAGANGGVASEITGGSISGSGTLTVGGPLDVRGSIADGGFTGQIKAGSEELDSGANIHFHSTKSGYAGLGTGEVAFSSYRDVVYIYDGESTTGSTTLTNTYTGNGQIKVVHSGSESFLFDFSANQAKDGNFTGTLLLQGADYHLYEDAGELKNATLKVSGGSHITVNSAGNVSDRAVGKLELAGGELDFGEMTEGSDSGQIVVGGLGDFTTPQGVIKVALGENNNATGSDVFDLNKDLSVQLIEGFDATDPAIDLSQLQFSSVEERQQVKQSDRYADGSATAVLTYSSGHLVGNTNGIGASWTLSKINLLSGNGSGFLIDASAETGDSGTISALITGEGSIEFAGGTITLNHANNTYTGNTYVTDGELVLAANEALGDSALLEVTGSGTVSVGSTAQSIGSISVAGENGLSMDASGSLTLTSGASTISSANNGVSGTVALSGKGTTLTIQNASGVGGDGTTISLDDDTSVIFAVSGFEDGGTYAKINNKLSGAGTVQIGNGTDKMHLELLNTNNAFGKLLVTNGATVLVNDLNADNNALGDAAVDIQAGGIARLYGSSGWTITNDLTLVEGGELVLAADDEAVNFAGTNQIISGGKVTLQSSVLYLGGDQGSSGATNAAVLDTAHLNVGSNGVLHVATGDTAQVLDKLTLDSDGHIWFDGTLGVSGTGTTQLGQLKVGSLGDMKGTIHLTASSTAGSGGEIDASKLLNVADSGSFQSLIEVIGTDETITDAQLSGTKLDVSGNTSVVSDIKDGSGNPVAEGTFGFGKTLVATEDGKHAGVQYELQIINLLQTLEISESGSLNVQITGGGNLLVSNALTLSNKDNDYSGSTTVSGTGSLVAGAGALGKTSALNVSGSFTNSGDNTVGIFDLSGSAVLNEGTLTVLGTTGETNDLTGTLTGSSSLALESGKTVVSQNNSGYAGDVVLGKDGGLDAEIHFNAGASLGSGTIAFAGSKSKLSVDASGATTLTNKLDLSVAGGEIVVSGDGDDTFAFRADQAASDSQAASDFLAGSKLTLTGTNYSFTTAGNDVLDNVALSVTSGTLTVNGDAGLSDRSVYGLSLTDAVVDFGKLGNGDGVLDLEHRNLTIGGSSGSTTVRLDSEFQSVESDTGSAAFMQGGSLTLIRDASNDFSGDLSKLKLELDGTTSAGTAIEQAVIQNNVETARLEGTAQGFGAVQGEDDGLWDLNLNLSFTTLRINKDSTFTVSEDGDIGLVITDNGADAAGSLSISDGASVQLLEANSYHGETSVSSGAELILAADNALGYTSALNTETGTSVAFGDTNQTIGEIHASGALVSDKDASGKLTITSGGEVSGANSGFYLDVDLTGNGDLTLTDVASLGTDNRVTITNADAELVLAGAGGSFSNALSGAGSLRIGAGSDVTLTGKNDLTGGLAVDASGKVSAGGNIYGHIGTGTVALAGEADFTLESQDTADWTWNNAVTGTGDLTLARDGSGSRDLLFEAGSLSGFGGTLTLDNWTIDLSETGGVKNATLGEIYGSDLTDLTLTNGAQALVTGEVGLETKNLTLGDGGRLTLNGVGAPGSTGTGSAHITVKELHLEDGFNIDLGIKDASVESSNLLLQDSGSGTTIDVATAMNGIDGDLANGTVTVNGESSTGQTIRFDVEQSGSVAQESGTVAEAIYGYGIRTSGDAGGQQDLQITYSLEGIDISSGKTLVLAGDEDDPSGNASTLSVYLTGDGNLRIADNTVRLSSKLKKGEYDYKGTTTVSSGATLYAETYTLGQTARLTTEAGANTYIEGDNTVRGITLASGGQLAIGSTDSMGGASDVTLTIVSSTDGDTSADQINHLYGELHGHGDLKVVGNGQVDEGVAADLTIHGSQTTFYGDLVLTNGAWVDIAATDSSLFGNNSAGNKVVVYKDSLLTIESDRSGDASFYGVFTDGEDGSGGGTVEISLLNTSDHFRFAAAQSDADFTGTFVLNSGTIDFTDLFTSTSGSGDPLAGATLVLNDGGVVDLVGDGSGTSASNERNLGGLTMAGGTIEAGAIGYKEGEGAFNSTINLGSGTLTLEHAEGVADDRQSTVVLGTTDDPIQISDSGSEILNAGSVGANVTVISGIGDLVLVDGDTSETVSGSTVIGSDYLHAERPANGTAQEIEQKVILADGSSEYRSVAETVREYDENFMYNSESGTLSIGYKVSDLGLLYETGNVSSSNYADDSRWQGLTITANAAADGTSVFDALIKNGENGSATGNIVFKGAAGKGTITLAGDENTYTGKTWLTENAQVVFDTDSGFGNTAALRVDAGSSVDFAGHDQSMDALFALGDDALKSTDEANLAVNGTAIINGANDNLHADWTFSGSVTIGDELSLGHGAVELVDTTTLTISGSEANGTIDNAITGGELTNIYVTSGANVSFANDDILSGPNFTGDIAVWSGASAGFAIESGATVSNGLTIGSTGKVSFESTSGGTLAFEDANIYGTLELNNVTFDLDAHGDAFKRGSSLVANAGTRIDVSDAVSGAVSNITLNSGSTVAFENGTPGAAGEGEVASINLGSSGTLTLAGDVTVDLDINDYADASDVEDAQGDLINRPLTAQDLTGQDGGAVLATLIAGQVSSDTADLNLKTDGNDVESNKLNIAIRNAANGEEVATGTYDYKLVLDKDGSGSGLKLSYGLTEVTIHDGKTLELTGTSADEDDNELTAAVKGTGNLRITEGEVTLVDKDSDYTGSTSVAAGAALVAGSAGHTLGQTSELRLEGATGVVSGASATILGEETVYGLNVQSGATLNLVAGSGEGAGAVLTVAGGEDGNVIAGNDALGQGGGKLAVSGDGTKLTIEGANSRFTGITSVESGAVLSAGNTASLGTGNTEIAAGGTLEVVAAVDATSGASRVVSQITNSVTGAGDVVINLSGTAQANQKMFRFADDQTSGFSGNIVLENGGYSLAYANDGDAETDYTANQLAAMNSRISVEENGHLYVSTVDHQINRYIDKHVRALTLDGGNIYFGGLRYDMTSMDESLGGQLQLAGDTDKSATLEIKSESLVNLDAGATNTLTDGSELLIADEGAKIDLIQNAADVVLGSGADTIWASSSDEADFTDLLDDYLKLNTVNSDAEQTLTQDGRDVAIVTRGFGSSGHNEVFGVEQNDSSTWDLYLNYHVSKIELIDSENAQGLLITNDEAGSDSDLTALVTGSGNLTLSGVSGTTIALGDGSDATQNDYTGRTTVTGSVTVKAAEDNAFGNTYRLNVESGAKVDFGKFDQTLGILEARGDDALAGTADSVVTITDDMIVTGKNDGFQSQLRLEFSGTGTVTDVGGLGTGDISIGKDYTLVIADENASDGSLVGNKLTGSGTVVIGRDDATGTIELGGSNAGFTGNVRVESDWALEASMDKGETVADRIGSGNLVLSSGATGSFTQTEGNLDWTSSVIGEGDLVLSAGKDSDVTISGGLDYFNGDITIDGGRFELASGNGNVENVDGSNLHATGEDTTVVVADQGTVILGDDLSVKSGASIVFEGDVTPGTIGDAQLVVAGDLTITESNVTINVGGELDPGDPDTASLNVQDVTSADRSDELALVIAEADNIVLSGNDLVVLGPDGNPINNPEDRLGVSIVDGDEEIATGFYDFGLTSSESGGRDILGVGYQLMEVNVKDGKTLVLNGAHAADVDYENASSFDADITGNGNFALANGELTLTGKNTYTGSTLVGDGTSETTLTVDRGSSLGDTSAVNVSDNATLVNRSDLTAAGSIQVASGGTVTLEDGSAFKVTDAANESNIAGTLTGSGVLHLNDNVDIDVAADKAQNFTGSVSVGSGAVYNLLSTVTDTVTVASSFKSDPGDDAVVGMTGDFSLEEENTDYHGAFVLSDGTVIRTDSIASLGAADATITTAGDYAEAGGTASQADDNATVILDYADRETVGDVTQTMTSGITFVKTGDGVVELSAESLGAGAVKSSEGGIIFGAAGDSTVYGTALTVEGGAWAAGFGGVGSLSVASDGAFYLGGVDGYNSIVSSGWTSSEGSSTVQFTVSGNVTNNGTIYVGNKNSSGDTPADSNYIGNELVIEGDYITDGGTLDLNAIIAGKDNSKSDHVTIKGEIDGTGFIDVNYDSSVSTGGELEYLGLVSVAEGESGDSLKLKDSIKIGDLYYRLMWSSEQNEYYLQSSVTDPGDDPWNTEDVENIHAGTRSALAFMQAQAFDLSLRGHLGETLYVDPVTGEQRKSSFWMVQRGDWTKFSNASGQMNADGNLYTTHLGTDLFKRETDGATFRWGVLAGFADGDFDVSSNVDGKSSKGSFRGYSAGLYMTAESKAESGPFLGLQLRWNRFDNEVGPDDYDVNGLSLTAEASWDQLLSKGLTDGGRHYEWRLEPHVRAYWTNFSDPGNWTSRLGETYSSDFDNGLLVRVGARTKIQTTLGTGPAWQAYAEANWVYNNGDYSTAMSTQYGDVTSTQNGAEFAEFRLGLEAQFTTNVNVWLEGHHQTGSDDYESTGAMFGFKYMW